MATATPTNGPTAPANAPTDGGDGQVTGNRLQRGIAATRAGVSNVLSSPLAHLPAAAAAGYGVTKLAQTQTVADLASGASGLVSPYLPALSNAVPGGVIGVGANKVLQSAGVPAKVALPVAVGLGGAAMAANPMFTVPAAAGVGTLLGANWLKNRTVNAYKNEGNWFTRTLLSPVAGLFRGLVPSQHEGVPAIEKGIGFLPTAVHNVATWPGQAVWGAAMGLTPWSWKASKATGPRSALSWATRGLSGLGWGFVPGVGIPDLWDGAPDLKFPETWTTFPGRLVRSVIRHPLKSVGKVLEYGIAKPVSAVAGGVSKAYSWLFSEPDGK